MAWDADAEAAVIAAVRTAVGSTSAEASYADIRRIANGVDRYGNVMPLWANLPATEQAKYLSAVSSQVDEVCNATFAAILTDPGGFTIEDEA